MITLNVSTSQGTLHYRIPAPFDGAITLRVCPYCEENLTLSRFCSDTCRKMHHHYRVGKPPLVTIRVSR